MSDLPLGVLWLGADPEMAIRSEEGKIIPAHRFFPPKTAPLEVEGHGAIHRDGISVEFNPKPSLTIAGLIGHMGALLKRAQETIGSSNRLVATSTVEVDLASFLSEAPPDVLLGGCEPSKNAYGRDVRIPNMRSYPLRHMAGHIHLSPGPNPLVPKFSTWALSQPHMYPSIVACLDAFVGVRCREVFNSQAYARRTFSYGQWGEYREQEYKSPRGLVKGLEYRTPGAEMWSHPGLVSLFLETVRWVVFNLEELIGGKAIPEKMRERVWKSLPGEKEWDWERSNLPWSVPGVYNPGTIWILGRRWVNDFIPSEIDPAVWLGWGKKDWSFFAGNLNVIVPGTKAAPLPSWVETVDEVENAIRA